MPKSWIIFINNQAYVLHTYEYVCTAGRWLHIHMSGSAFINICFYPFYLWFDLISQSPVRIYVGIYNFILYVYTFLFDGEFHPIASPWVSNLTGMILVLHSRLLSDSFYKNCTYHEIVDGYAFYFVVLLFVLCQKWRNKDVQSINQNQKLDQWKYVWFEFDSHVKQVYCISPNFDWNKVKILSNLKREGTVVIEIPIPLFHQKWTINVTHNVCSFTHTTEEIAMWRRNLDKLFWQFQYAMCNNYPQMTNSKAFVLALVEQRPHKAATKLTPIYKPLSQQITCDRWWPFMFGCFLFPFKLKPKMIRGTIFLFTKYQLILKQ